MGRGICFCAGCQGVQSLLGCDSSCGLSTEVFPTLTFSLAFLEGAGKKFGFIELGLRLFTLFCDLL